jgi:hypothetical protein
MRAPWLPHGFEFLSGLPEAARRRTMVMPVQLFVDESETGADKPRRHFAMLGLVATAEAWASFADEWDLCLHEPPAINVFKMKDAAGCAGPFRGWKSSARDKKLKRLAQIINRHVRLVVLL